MSLEVVPVALDSLELDARNVRVHNDRNLKAIADSLEHFGQRKPLVVMPAVDGKHRVIAGNGTLEAARLLGWESVSVSVVPSDWTEDQAAAYAIADNRSAELAEWDDEGLQAQLADLAGAGWDPAVLGFDAVLDGDEAVDVQEDEPPAPEAEAITQAGDVWILGEHRLVCGDSTEPDTYEALMQGELAQCVFTDPPYNVDYSSADGKTIANDNMSEAAFARFIRSAYQRMHEHTEAGGAIYVCHADSATDAFRSEMRRSGWLLKQCLIWVKNAFVLSRQDYNWQHEPILYGWKAGAAHSWHGPHNRSTVVDDEVVFAKLKKAELVELLEGMLAASTVLREDRPTKSAEHPTMKPVRLVARLVANSTRRGDVVLDPFGGSGSTLIACEQLGRACRVVELDPIYCDVIVKRWENLTGETAEREVASAA